MLSPRCSPEKGQRSSSHRQRDDSEKSAVRTPSPRRSALSSSCSSLSTKSHMTSSPPPISSSSPPPFSCPSNPSSMSSFKNKPTLAQEIYDEFLVCKICLEAFKNPKCLECLHTFCDKCIEAHVQSESTYKKYSDYREFTCPLCRKRTQLPIGGVKKLPDNFLVSSLSEMVGRRRVSKYPFCDICKMVDQKYREGTAKCLDCAKMLCTSCVAAHQEIKVTSGHSIFDIEIEKNIGCMEHPDEMVRFYCEPCEVCICVLCTFKEHRQHKVTQFSEAVALYKTAMETTVDQCLEKMDKLDGHIAALNQCEDIMMVARKKIKETAAAFVQDIERREKQLLTELDNVYGGECLECIEKKQDLANHVDTIRSTCKLAKTILAGKDIELLLIRKDIQEKLALLKMVEFRQLPPTVGKVVEFVSGEVEFGYLLDHERPLLTTMTMRKKSSKNQAPQPENKQKQATTRTAKDGGNVQSSSRFSTSSEESESSSESDESSESSDRRPAYRHGTSTGGHGRHGATVERSTMTDTVVLVEKAVNTKARSMLNSGTGSGGHGGRRSSADDWNDHGSSGEKKSKKREKVGPGPPTIVEISFSEPQQQMLLVQQQTAKEQVK